MRTKVVSFFIIFQENSNNRHKSLPIVSMPNGLTEIMKMRPRPVVDRRHGCNWPGRARSYCRTLPCHQPKEGRSWMFWTDGRCQPGRTHTGRTVIGRNWPLVPETAGTRTRSPRSPRWSQYNVRTCHKREKARRHAVDKIMMHDAIDCPHIVACPCNSYQRLPRTPKHTRVRAMYAANR